ncbi:major facilitator superfamily transporter [Grosmannia clavigera kw1407]|uniref:Major facilitator superfamily transporter n=1 Tax=Grosmannia clavigera (strain kw1407 / UAMH 11150) TaxID=655863 RepID=F0XA14_GROCL|nr:major facilitator superfamily transporter [Grosmannia clavigera kw1407]EFX05285.1 major facilitator superfamily transporter [Grosmannia clavigera kw1407]
MDIQPTKRQSVEDDASVIKASLVSVGRENLAHTLPPHESYEGRHRWDAEMTWTPEEERWVVRKADMFFLPILCLMFFGLQLDRGNLSNALADNLLKDLKINSDDYNNLVCFLAAEFPVQMLTKRLGFKYVLPIMMFCWSTVSWAQAWMTDRTSFYITRALIGLFEGGFIPELSVRLAVFWSTLNIARVISALLAAAILKMRGIGGHTGWFWAFLLEGILTALISIIAFLYLPSSPTSTKSFLWRKSWYTEREEAIMVNRILRDDPAKGRTALKEPVTWHDIKSAWSDKSMWGLYFIGLVAYIPATPVQAYLTLTIKRLGFTTFDANMLTMPSAGIQVVTMLVLAFSSDYFNERTFHCFFGELWILPMLIALRTIHDGGRDWSRFTLITLTSGYPYFHPIVSAWISENTFDVKKRTITAATYNVVVQIGSLIGSQIYRKYDAPYYKQGNTVLLSICALSLVVFIVQRQVLVHLNKKKSAVWDVMSAEEKTAYQEDTLSREKEGNRRLDFRLPMLAGYMAQPLSMPKTTATGRKIGSKRACDGCKVRKVRCSGAVPCGGCRAAGMPCTFLRNPAVRGPKSLRAKTMLLIAKTQQHQQQEEEREGERHAEREREQDDGEQGYDGGSPMADDRLLSSLDTAIMISETAAGNKTPVQSLVLVLCIFRLRLFPLWPIVDIEATMASLHHRSDEDNDGEDGSSSSLEAYALANSIGAATAAQLKLTQTDVGSDAAAMEAECQRARMALQRDGSRERPAGIDTVRISFFLHVYHENKAPGGTESLLYLREAITLAQILQLRQQGSLSSSSSSSTRERQTWQKIVALLFVTERGVALLHKLPAILHYDMRQLDFDDADDATRVLPGFRKLVGLFWMLDQAGAFSILQRASPEPEPEPESEFQSEFQSELTISHRGRLALLQQRLRDVAVESTVDNDVQTADICVTRQWMQAVLWHASSAMRPRGRSVSSEQATSLSHPVQIARRFLQAIARLPNTAVEAHGPAMVRYIEAFLHLQDSPLTSQEYKIYELARIVLDAVAADSAGLRDSLDMTRDVVVQLQKKLASYRGGNKTLLLLLHTRTRDLLSDNRIHHISSDGLAAYDGSPQRPAVLSSQMSQVYTLQTEPTTSVRSATAENEDDNDSQDSWFHTTASAPSQSQQINATYLTGQPFQAPTTAVDVLLANSALWEPSGIWDLAGGTDMMDFDASSAN